MHRVPLNRSLNLIDIGLLRPEFERYVKELIKNPLYGSKRAAREAKQRAHHKKKRLERQSKSI
jgi:hypothetical protein